MASYLVQEEDGIGRFTLEEDGGFLLLEDTTPVEHSAAVSLPLSVSITARTTAEHTVSFSLPLVASISSRFGTQAPETVTFGLDCVSGTYRCRGPQARGFWKQYQCRHCRARSRGR